MNPFPGPYRKGKGPFPRKDKLREHVRKMHPPPTEVDSSLFVALQHNTMVGAHAPAEIAFGLPFNRAGNFSSGQHLELQDNHGIATGVNLNSQRYPSNCIALGNSGEWLHNSDAVYLQSGTDNMVGMDNIFNANMSPDVDPNVAMPSTIDTSGIPSAGFIFEASNEGDMGSMGTLGYANIWGDIGGMGGVGDVFNAESIADPNISSTRGDESSDIDWTRLVDLDANGTQVLS
jgi:hypothetical protein